MEDFAELTAEGINHITDRYGDQIYDGVSNQYKKRRGRKNSKRGAATGDTEAKPQRPEPGTTTNGNRRYRNSLPSPERERDTAYTNDGPPASNRRDIDRDDSLERESQRSARVLREYENETDDRLRKPQITVDRSIYLATDRDSRRDSGRMAYPDNYGRTRSQPPDGTRYYDDDGYGSDYDDRTGVRTKTTGRGYGSSGYDDRYRETDVEPYREYYETERYRGPAGNFQPARGSRSQVIDPPPTGSNAPGYGPGTVAPYSRKSRTEVSRRSRSKSRRSYSGSRSRSRSRSQEGVRGKVEEWFDPTAKGIGVGIAGAVVGGLAGREFGGERHRRRDMIIGALVGGLGANAAENKWREYRHPEERGSRREAYAYEDSGRRPRSR